MRTGYDATKCTGQLAISLPGRLPRCDNLILPRVTCGVVWSLPAFTGISDKALGYT